MSRGLWSRRSDSIKITAAYFTPRRKLRLHCEVLLLRWDRRDHENSISANSRQNLNHSQSASCGYGQCQYFCRADDSTQVIWAAEILFDLGLLWKIIWLTVQMHQKFKLSKNDFSRKGNEHMPVTKYTSGGGHCELGGLIKISLSFWFPFLKTLHIPGILKSFWWKI